MHIATFFFFLWTNLKLPCLLFQLSCKAGKLYCAYLKKPWSESLPKANQRLQGRSRSICLKVTCCHHQNRSLPGSCMFSIPISCFSYQVTCTATWVIQQICTGLSEVLLYSIVSWSVIPVFCWKQQQQWQKNNL